MSLPLHRIDEAGQHNVMRLVINHIDDVEDKTTAEIPANDRHLIHHVIAEFSILIRHLTALESEAADDICIRIFRNDGQAETFRPLDDFECVVVLIQRDSQNRILTRHLKTSVDDATHRATSVHRTYDV
jgi:hypothetical protein